MEKPRCIRGDERRKEEAFWYKIGDSDTIYVGIEPLKARYAVIK